MILNRIAQSTRNGRTRKALELRCDWCKTEYVRHQNTKVLESRTEHWCCHECFSHAIAKGGSVDLRRRETNVERYGIPYVINCHDIAVSSGQSAHTPEIEARRWKKIHEGWKSTATVLRRGLTLVRSRPEIEFFDRLGESLNVTIECPKYINRWFIDGYISAYDVWLQFDGVYWHSRPDRVKNDYNQNEWFAAQKMSLLRITDKEYLKDPMGAIDAISKRILEICKVSH